MIDRVGAIVEKAGIAAATAFHGTLPVSPPPVATAVATAPPVPRGPERVRVSVNSVRSSADRGVSSIKNDLRDPTMCRATRGQDVFKVLTLISLEPGRIY